MGIKTTIAIPFKSCSMINDGKLNAKVDTDDLLEMISCLVMQDDIETSDLMELLRKKIELCDRKTLTRILPPAKIHELMGIYSRIESGF